MKRLLTILLLAALATGGALAQEAITVETFTPAVTGVWASFSTSYDGSRIACNYGGEIYLYENGTHTYIGPGHFLSSSIGISADGTAIMSAQDDAFGLRNPAIWYEADDWDVTLLGGIPGYDTCDNSYGSGYSLDQDGSIAVGLGWNACQGTAFMWTPDGGMMDIGPVRASYISGDGSRIMGFQHHPTFGVRQPVYWVNDPSDPFGVVSGPHLMGAVDGLGECYGSTFDGSVIVGEYNDGTMFSSQAFKWTEADGITLLGTVEPFEDHASRATAIADDGTIVGTSGTSGPWGFMRAFIYREGEPMAYLQDWLLAHGATVPEGFEDSDIVWASTLSGDGSTMIAQWQDMVWNQGYYLIHFEGTVGIEDQEPEVAGDALPSAFALRQNYPNPFNPMTSISFAVPRAEHVRLGVYDLAGRLVRMLVDETRDVGEHTVVWDGRDLAGNAAPSGTYLYRLDAPSFSRTETMTLLK